MLWHCRPTTRTATRLIGPALGGVLIEVFGGYNWNFYLESAAYIGALIASGPSHPYEQSRPLMNQPCCRIWVKGLSYIWNHKVILYLIAIMLIPNLVFQPVVFILPIFVSDILGSSEGIGGCFFRNGVGGVTASIIVGNLDLNWGRENYYLRHDFRREYIGHGSSPTLTSNMPCF
ncbi:MAG: hypothetical protein CM1200mP15_10590 [Dehalococcoidia bacterium]|nr:MAG: hypothetical protein CM1200mP15_10590 [Dehalococcoidia bacterium]